MKAPRLPTAIHHAVMRILRENLAHANLNLGRNCPSPTLAYLLRGTLAVTALLQSY